MLIKNKWLAGISFYSPISILSSAESVAEVQISRFLRHEIITLAPP